MFGLPADTVRKKFRTRCVRDNALNPVFDDEPFVFKKVVLPELASIRIAAYEEGGKFIGHRVLPVIGLCPGFKHVTLRTELGLPIPLATLFLCIVVKVNYEPSTHFFNYYLRESMLKKKCAKKFLFFFLFLLVLVYIHISMVYVHGNRIMSLMVCLILLRLLPIQLNIKVNWKNVPNS